MLKPLMNKKEFRSFLESIADQVPYFTEYEEDDSLREKTLSHYKGASNDLKEDFCLQRTTKVASNGRRVRL